MQSGLLDPQEPQVFREFRDPRDRQVLQVQSELLARRGLKAYKGLAE